jgi:hypothetical protein
MNKYTLTIEIITQVEVTEMDSRQLSCEQLTAIKATLTPAFNYLLRLQRRMEQRRFPQSDLVYAAVCQAYDAMHKLNTLLHHAECERRRQERR